MKNKIIIVLLALVIVVGIVIMLTSGFNLGSDYSSSRRLNIKFKENFEISDVNDIAKEILGETEYKIDYIDEFKASVMINAKEISDEQVTNFENKLKEKYNTFADINKEENENSEEESKNNEIIQVIDMPITDVYDFISVYIKPVIITTTIVIILLALVYRNLGIVKSLVIPICLILGLTTLYVSTVAILRIPVNEYTVSVGVFIYVMSLIIAPIYLKTVKDKE